VFSYILAMGTHANFSRLFRIVEWDGDQFVDLIRSSGPDPHVAEVQNGDGEVLDSDGDGLLELALANGVGRGPDASALERPRTDVWAWDGEAFALDHSRSASPPLFRIQAIWDGDSATQRGDYDAALAFYQQAISDPQLLGWSQDRMASDAVYEGGATPTPDPDEHLRLSAYGWYRIMLLHVAGKRLAEAQSAYDTLQGQHPEGSAGRAYAALATVFWEEFNRSQDVAAACDRAAEYATDHGDRVLAPLGSRFYGFGQRDYAAEEICPSQLLPTVAPTIVTFRVELEDVAAGKLLTFEWETIGATRAEIWSGATPRRPKMWEVPPTGALTVVQADTYIRDPSVVLIAYDDQNQRASRTIRTEWPCAHTYFFDPAPDACPLHEAIDTAAAGQAFEHGRMIWLERIHGGERVILVLYDDGHLARLDDTWTPAEPESDPTLVPPDGLLQPVRGFGKAWRENAAVRERLGWALAPEQGFEGHWQEQLRESIPRMAFVQTLDGKTVKLHGWELGTPSWQSSWTDFPEP